MNRNRILLENAVSVIEYLVERVKELYCKEFTPTEYESSEDYAMIEDAKNVIDRLNDLNASMKMPKEKAVEIVKRQVSLMNDNGDFDLAEAFEVLLEEVK